MKKVFKCLQITFLLTLFLSSCSNIPKISNPLNSPKAAANIDARVFKTIDQMYMEYPYSRQLAAKASGVLVMPLVTEAGFGLGAGYGRGCTCCRWSSEKLLFLNICKYRDSTRCSTICPRIILHDRYGFKPV